MYFDLVFPKGNEESLVAMAKALGFKKLFLCYTLQDSLLKQRFSEARDLSSENIDVQIAVLVHNQQQVMNAKQITKNIIGLGKQELFVDKRVKYLIDFESEKKPDFIHHRRSGLTQVHVKAAVDKDKIILVNAQPLLNGRINQSVLLGRFAQNNQIFSKYKANAVVVSGATLALEMRSPQDLQNLLKLD